ncbi:hypothetical protein SteCoe_6699 [Stentor coeruleus]|uniref:Uncharacterized protein n=1 Tax=Stentor coeruleus TaxID=5963 RepID=A0A1R2CPB5_9CILI|nr:hypothetical protein SteCoe_6699 [Stentor coeruleus]
MLKATSISAKLYKCKNIDEILRNVNPKLTSVFDLTLALKIIANHVMENGRLEKPQEIVNLHKHVQTQFHILKSNEIANIIYFIRTIKDFNIRDLDLTLTEQNLKKIKDIMGNRSISSSIIAGIYHDLNCLKLNCLECDKIMLRMLEDYNTPINFISIKVILYSLIERISPEISDILIHCYRRLENYYFTPALHKEIIGLIKIILRIELSLSVCPESLFNKISDFLQNQPLKTSDYETVFGIFALSPFPNVILSTLNKKFIRSIQDTPHIITLKILNDYLGILKNIPDVQESEKQIALDFQKKLTENFSSLDTNKMKNNSDK